MLVSQSDRSTLHSNLRIPILPEHAPLRQVRRLAIIIVDIVERIALLEGARADDAAPVLLQTGLAGNPWIWQSGWHGDWPPRLTDPYLNVLCFFESCDILDRGIEVVFRLVDLCFFPIGEDVGDEEVGGVCYL